MDNVNGIVTVLNDSLNNDQIDNEHIFTLLTHLRKRFNLNFKLIDFEYYNEDKMNLARTEKIEGVQSQNYEYVSSKRELELACKKYIELKTEIKIDKSMFYSDFNYLVYCYLGSDKNDKLFKDMFWKIALSFPVA